MVDDVVRTHRNDALIGGDLDPPECAPLSSPSSLAVEIDLFAGSCELFRVHRLRRLHCHGFGNGAVLIPPSPFFAVFAHDIFIEFLAQARRESIVLLPIREVAGHV
jgi:hypothetical protein